MATDLRAAYLAMRRSGAVEFPPECLEYMFHLIFRSSFQGRGFRDVPAEELCGIFRAQTADDFGAFADEALDRFGIRSGDDLGRAVFLLAEYGCLNLNEGETRAAYAAAGPFRSGRG